MSQPHGAKDSGNVVNLTAYRRRKGRAKSQRKQQPPAGPGSSLHIEISPHGDISFPPIVIQRPHALAILRMVLAISDHILNVHVGNAR
jgi:hypothetical protein